MRKSLRYLVGTVGLLLASYLSAGVGDPLVQILSPASGAAFVEGDTIELQARAANAVAAARVDYYADDQWIGGAAMAPYLLHWPNVPAGRYELTARGTWPGGFSATSEVVSIFVDARPVLALSRTNVSYFPGAGAVLLDDAALVSDADSPNFDGGTLAVEFVANGLPEDRLGIRNQGAGPGNIFTAGQTVSYSVQPIGSFSGGTSGTSPLVITLNGKATAEAVQALARSLTYESVATTSSLSSRRVRLMLTDGDGGSSAAAFLNIDVRPANTAPVAVAKVLPLAFLSKLDTNGVVISSNNSNALVVLEGSMSSDADHDLLSYSWFKNDDAAPFAVGPVVTQALELGQYSIRLEVSDGRATGTATVAIEVISAGEAVEEIIRQIARPGLPRSRLRPLIVTLKAAGASFERGNFTAGRNQLGALQNKAGAELARIDPALAAEWTEAVQMLLDAVGQR
jgi:hypothetical protein